MKEKKIELALLGILLALAGLLTVQFLMDPARTNSGEQKQMRNGSPADRQLISLQNPDQQNWSRKRSGGERSPDDTSTNSRPDSVPVSHGEQQEEFAPEKADSYSESYIEKLAATSWFQDRVRGMIRRGELKSHLNNYEEARVWQEINERTSISEEDVPDSVDGYDVAEELIRVSLSGNKDKEGQTNQNNGNLVPLNFSEKVSKITHKPHNIQSEFSPDTGRIYACFQLKDKDKGIDKVLVKWIHTLTGKVIYFEKEPIKRNNSWNYVWVKMLDGWWQGKYLVKIYRITGEEGGMDLIAEGRYRVSK